MYYRAHSYCRSYVRTYIVERATPVRWCRSSRWYRTTRLAAACQWSRRRAQPPPRTCWCRTRRRLTRAATLVRLPMRRSPQYACTCSMVTYHTNMQTHAKRKANSKYLFLVFCCHKLSFLRLNCTLNNSEKPMPILYRFELDKIWYGYWRIIPLLWHAFSQRGDSPREPDAAIRRISRNILITFFCDFYQRFIEIVVLLFNFRSSLLHLMKNIYTPLFTNIPVFLFLNVVLYSICIAGERPAAMQTGSAGLSNSSRCILALLAACALHARLLRALLASWSPGPARAGHRRSESSRNKSHRCDYVEWASATRDYVTVPQRTSLFVNVE